MSVTYSTTSTDSHVRPWESPPSKRRRLDDDGVFPARLGTERIASSRPALEQRTKGWTATISAGNRTANLQFDQNASIIFVGLRGSGLSSLAVIAAKSLRYRYVDTETRFLEDTGMTKAIYIDQHGHLAYRKAMTDVLDRVLIQHTECTAIVCGAEIFEGRSRSLLHSFGAVHPIIMVHRDLSDIQKHLKIADGTDAFHILQRSQELYRQISNVEFFNLPEHEADESLAVTLSRGLRRRNATQQTGLLQNVKTDLTQFLNLLGLAADAHIPDLLQPVTPERRIYSCALKVRLKDVLKSPDRLKSLDSNSDAIELIITDNIEKTTMQDQVSRGVQLVRRFFSMPVILNFECLDGSTPATSRDRISLLRWALRLAPEYLVLNLDLKDQDIKALVASTPVTRIIGQAQLRSSTGSPWDSAQKVCERAASLGCQIVRIINIEATHDDDRACLRFQLDVESRLEMPVIAINERLSVMSSRVLNKHLTPVIHPEIASSLETNMLSSAQLNAARFASFAQQSLHFYVFGANTRNSLSPTLHRTGFQSLGMPHQYETIETNDLKAFEPLVNETFGGATITLPFKSEVLCLLDSLSEAAKAIQASNTILPVRGSDNALLEDVTAPLCKTQRHRAGPVVALHGENTDWIALRACIARHLSPANAISDASSALIVGAGGMARAAIYALVQLGVRNIVLWNRTKSRAVQAANHFNTLLESQSRAATPQRFGTTTPVRRAVTVRVIDSLNEPWPDDLAHPCIIISTIPKFDVQDSLDFSIPEHWLRRPTGGIIIDLSYKSDWTNLMQQAADHADKGWILVEPLEVLIEQGCAQSELFTGCPAPRKAIIKSVVELYQRLREDAG